MLCHLVQGGTSHLPIWYKDTDSKLIGIKSLSTVKRVYFLLQIWDGWDVSRCTARSKTVPKYCAAKKKEMIPISTYLCHKYNTFSNQFYLFLATEHQYALNLCRVYCGVCCLDITSAAACGSIASTTVWTTVPCPSFLEELGLLSQLFCSPFKLRCYCGVRTYSFLSIVWISYFVREHAIFFFARSRCTTGYLHFLKQKSLLTIFWKRKNVPANVWFAPLRIEVIPFLFHSARNTHEASETHKKYILARRNVKWQPSSVQFTAHCHWNA